MIRVVETVVQSSSGAVALVQFVRRRLLNEEVLVARSY